MPEKSCIVAQTWKQFFLISTYKPQNGLGQKRTLSITKFSLSLHIQVCFRDGTGTHSQSPMSLQPNRFHSWLLSGGHRWRHQEKTAQIVRLLYQAVEWLFLEIFEVSLKKSLQNLSPLDTLGEKAGLDDLQRPLLTWIIPTAQISSFLESDH